MHACVRALSGRLIGCLPKGRLCRGMVCVCRGVVLDELAGFLWEGERKQADIREVGGCFIWVSTCVFEGLGRIAAYSKSFTGG